MNTKVKVTEVNGPLCQSSCVAASVGTEDNLRKYSNSDMFKKIYVRYLK